MQYASVCDGIGAAHAAWQPFGWRCAWTSEIEPFPMAVVEQRWGFPNLGNMTRITDEQLQQHGPIALLVGGTPCQSFSVAGLRKGLADPRGNLALVYLGLVDRARPRWVVWENVPGVLSSGGGRDFGAFLGALGELGYGFAYRVLDAQFVRVESHARAVPQRRRRVFVVGHLGDWRPAAAVLLERQGMCGHPPPRRVAGQGLAADAFGSLATQREAVPDMTTRTGTGTGRDGMDEYCVLHAPEVSGPLHTALNTACGDGNDDRVLVQFGHALPTTGYQGDRVVSSGDAWVTLSKEGPNNGGGGGALLLDAMVVRRLTPRECERLQGFPDDHTAITYRGKPAADGPRYKALGNSMAVNVMSWIGQRIQNQEASGV